MLDNDMLIDQINLREQIKSESFPNVRPITQAEYDLLAIPDINTYYIILGAPDGRVYNGTTLILPEKQKTMYLLGPSDKYGEFIIYLNQMIRGETRLIKISRFSDIDVALRTLDRLNNVGNHTDWSLQTYNMLVSYIQKEITIHDLIIGIISLFGYRNDPRLQRVIQTANRYGVDRSNRDLPISLRESLFTWRHINSNYIFHYYADLYDLVVLYDFFRDKKYQEEFPDLKEVVDKVFNIILGDTR